MMLHTGHGALPDADRAEILKALVISLKGNSRKSDRKVFFFPFFFGTHWRHMKGTIYCALGAQPIIERERYIVPLGLSSIHTALGLSSIYGALGLPWARVLR
jgi:hypothetical protein